jgi:hypothetical protein
MEAENQPDAMALLEELEEAPAAETRMDTLLAEIGEDRELATAQATARFLEDDGVRTLRFEIPERVKSGVKEYEQTLATAETQLREERLGKKEYEDVLAKAETELDALFLRERGHIEDIGEKLARRFRMYPPGPASPELLAEVQTGFAAFDVKTGLQILTEAETALNLTRDEGIADHERERQKKLLGLLHLPLVQRMATQPPRHARPYQEAFRKLQQAIETHLDNVNGGALDRLGKGFVQQAVWEFDNAKGAIKHMNGWDNVIVSAAAPSLWPKERE